MSKTLKLIGTISLIAITLAGCAPTSQQPSVEDLNVTSTQPTTAGEYLILAIQQRGQRAAELRIKAAELFIADQRFREAADSLSAIQLQTLEPTTALKVVTLEADALLRINKASAALDRLTDTSLPLLDTDQQAALGLAKADAFEQQGNFLTAALVLSELSDNLGLLRQQQIHDRIWALLQQINNEDLVAASLANYGFLAQGWVELKLALSERSDLSAQRDAILSWQTLWQSHPATSTPPSSIAILINQDLFEAQRVLVALPFTGSLAEPARIIFEGIIAEIDQRKLKGLSTPELITINTQAITARSLIAWAVEQDIDLVLGPLRGKLIDELASFDSLPMPFITFNQTDAATKNLFQLDLGSDQEVKQVVERASLEGHRRFALITPAASWGARIERNFKASITEYQAETVVELNYNVDNDLSSQIASMLNIQLSNQRYKALKGVLAEPIEYDERPRRDIDAIFLAAQSSDARQIKPMLAYHFAGDYPLYATSHLFEGDFNIARDVDLNSVQFPDQPWLLEPTSPLNQSLSLSREDTSSRLGRLYALGADAVKVYPYLVQLQNSPKVTVNGETGSLSLNNSNRFTRTLTWAEFVDGIPVLLGSPIIPETSDLTPIGEDSSELKNTELN